MCAYICMRVCACICVWICLSIIRSSIIYVMRIDLASYGNEIKIEVRWSWLNQAHLRCTFACSAKASPYTMKNIATINIYPPRTQSKHTKELKNLCRASAINMADVNLIFSFVGWWKQKYIKIVCRCASYIELWESINALSRDNTFDYFIRV